MTRGNSQSTFRKIDKRNFLRNSVILSFVLFDDIKTRALSIHIINNIPHAGASGLAETGMPRYGWPVASSRAANPSTAGSWQEALPEVLGHKSVNYRIYTAAIPNTGLRERRFESHRQLDAAAREVAVADTRGRIDMRNQICTLNLECVNARHNFDPSPFYMQILYRLFYLKWIPPIDLFGEQKEKCTMNILRRKSKS